MDQNALPLTIENLPTRLVTRLVTRPVTRLGIADAPVLIDAWQTFRHDESGDGLLWDGHIASLTRKGNLTRFDAFAVTPLTETEAR